MKAWSGGFARGGAWLRGWLLACACLAWACGDGPTRTTIEMPDVPDAALPPTTHVGHAGDEPDAGSDLEPGDTVVPDDGDPDVPDLPPSEPPVDACGDVPAEGRCKDEHTVERCLTGGGTSQERISTLTCGDDQLCSADATGARCQTAGTCLEGSTRCADASTLETCSSDSWLSEGCTSGCVTSALGSFCATEIATKMLSGRATYEARLPNDSFDDWSSALSTLPAAGFLLLSYHGETLVDAVVTSDAEASLGSFSIRVADPAGADDTLVLAAAGSDGRGGLTHAVGNPGYAPSGGYRATFDDPPDPSLWSYSFAVSTRADGDVLTIPEQQGAGAAHVFATLHRVFQFAQGFYAPEAPKPAIVWLGMGTAWDCGSCMAEFPVHTLDSDFEHQLWLDGSADQGYWATPVTAHELGHYVMCAFGFAPSEAGTHYLGIATNPGLAWSEGWATFFGAMVRNDARYFTKQQEVFFWFDVDARDYAGDLPWERAVSSGGLEQRLDENEVAALLWGTYRAIGDFTPVLTALSSPRMTVAPFARGYTRRYWSDPLHPENYGDTNDPHPYLADFLDALRCADAISASTLDQVTRPDSEYPYPSESPLCD